MAYEEIQQRVSMIVFFQQGAIHPLRFKWNNTVYKIDRVHSHWTTRDGDTKVYHFSVSVGTPDCYELTFDLENLAWHLARVYLEG